MYADDAVIMHSSPSVENLVEDIQNDMITIFDWLKINKLQLNINKTNYIIFDKHNTIDHTIPNITVNNETITRVNQTKYLGLTIDRKLFWQGHISKIKNKIRPIVFAIRRLRTYLHKDALLDI